MIFQVTDNKDVTHTLHSLGPFVHGSKDGHGVTSTIVDLPHVIAEWDEVTLYDSDAKEVQINPKAWRIQF